MKKLLLIALLMMCSWFAGANDKDGILFAQGSWKEITAKAKREGKMIFIDCYTSWCGPCKRLSAEVFPLKNVAEVFNKDFINYKVDMEKGEGIDLQRKFHVGAYPTLLWVDHKGNVVHRIVGFVKPEKLLAEAQKAKSGGNAQAKLEMAYKKNRDNPEVLKAYLNSLVETADSRAKELALVYLSIIPKEAYLSKENYDLIAAYVQSPFSQAISYIVEHRAAFDEKFNRQRVDVTFENIYSRYANALVGDVKEGKEFDEPAFQNLIAFMQEQKFPLREQVIANTRIRTLKLKKNWKAYAAKINSIIEAGVYGKISPRIYEQWYEPIVESDCRDNEVLENAFSWINMGLDDDGVFNLPYYERAWAAKVRVLERMDGKPGELAKAKIEHNLIKQLEKKQKEYTQQQAEKTKALQDLIYKKTGS